MELTLDEFIHQKILSHNSYFLIMYISVYHVIIISNNNTTEYTIIFYYTILYYYSHIHKN